MENLKDIQLLQPNNRYYPQLALLHGTLLSNNNFGVRIHISGNRENLKFCQQA